MIEPYMAVGLVTTVWGARTRDDIERNIHPQQAHDDPQVVDIENRLNPDFPPVTVEDYRFWNDPTHRPEGARSLRFVVQDNGSAAAHCALVEMWWIQRADTYWVSIGVAPEVSNRGIGSCLYGHLARQAGTLGATLLYAEVREDNARARRFAGSRGFEPTGHLLRMSRLDVREANLDGYLGLPERLAREGICITTLEEVGTDDEKFLQALHETLQENMKDEPSSEDFAQTPFDLWRRQFLEAPGMSPACSWIALDGNRVIGSAFLRRRGHHAAFNNGTDVTRDFRGRGIAKAMKLRQIEWAREHGVDFLFTGNDLENEPMLAINIGLGYKPLPSKLEVAKKL